ncbi:hypothetical protein MNBD_PLANCTO03-145, partial [hydrothermal vent metagenome]
MMTRQPTPVGLMPLGLLTVGLVTVWSMVALGRGSLWLGALATLSMAAGWWLIFRHAQQLRSTTTRLDRTLRQLADEVGASPDNPEAILDLLRDRLSNLDETVRSLRALFDAIDEPVLALD